MAENDPARPELAELGARIAATLAPARPEAVARRRKTGQRTGRENIDNLVDPGSFSEYGGLALAAQRARHSTAELIASSPADGLIAGTATIDGARVMLLVYDYTVFAGTQGGMSHKKLDRMLTLATEWRIPIVLFAEGGVARTIPTCRSSPASTRRAFTRSHGTAGWRRGSASSRADASQASLLGLRLRPTFAQSRAPVEETERRASRTLRWQRARVLRWQRSFYAVARHERPPAQVAS